MEKMNRRSLLKGLLATLILPKIKIPDIPRWSGYNGLYAQFLRKEDQHLIRSQLWCAQIKQLLLDELETMRFKNDILTNGDDVT